MSPAREILLLGRPSLSGRADPSQQGVGVRANCLRGESRARSVRQSALSPARSGCGSRMLTSPPAAGYLPIQQDPHCVMKFGHGLVHLLRVLERALAAMRYVRPHLIEVLGGARAVSASR
jgi:hypothetical protein